MFYRRSFVLLVALVVSVGLVGCGSKQTGKKKAKKGDAGFQSEIQAPDWFFNPPQEEGSLFAAATAKSSRLTVALDKAELQAKRDLAGSLQSTLQGQRERYVEEIGNADNESQETAVREQYQDLVREMVEEELQGVRLAEKSLIREGRGYRAYVLMELTMDDIKSKLSNKEELRTRFNAKQFEDDMEQNLQDMRDRQSQ